MKMARRRKHAGRLSGEESPRGRIYGSDPEPTQAVPVAAAALVDVQVYRAASDTWEQVPLGKPSMWSRFLTLIGWR